MRPTGWEDELDFGAVTMAGLRSPLTMWLIEGAEFTSSPIPAAM